MLLVLRFDLRNPAFAGVAPADRYRAAVDMAEWADRHGALAVSISYYHGIDDGYLPSPLLLAAAVATRTSQVVLAINALVAPFHDPLRLAEDIAVLDQLSGGRCALTLAAGYVPQELAMFGVAPGDRAALVEEAVATLRAAWTGEPFTYRGRPARVTPTPAQPGGPPLVLGGNSEAAARRAARIGDGFLPTDATWWAPYREECLRLGKPDPGPGMDLAATVVLLAEDPEAAWGVLGPYLLHDCNAYGAWQVAAGQTTFRPVAGTEELRAGDQYRILTPDQYAAELAPQGEAAFVHLHPMVGGIPPALAWEHLHLFEETFLR